MTPSVESRDLVKRQTMCTGCQQWIPGNRAKFNTHIRTTHPELWAQMEAYRAELLGGEA